MLLDSLAGVRSMARVAVFGLVRMEPCMYFEIQDSPVEIIRIESEQP